MNTTNIKYKKLKESQNVGLGMSRNLGVSLINSSDLSDLTPLDDMLNLIALFDDDTLSFKCIFLRIEDGQGEWAFQYIDKEDIDTIWYYPVTKLDIDEVTNRGMVDAIFSTYQLSSTNNLNMLLTMNGYWEVNISGAKQVGALKKDMYIKDDFIKNKNIMSIAIENIKKKSTDEVITEMIKKEKKEKYDFAYLKANTTVTKPFDLVSQEFESKDGVMQIKERRIGGGFMQGTTVADVFKHGKLIKQGISLEDAYVTLQNYLKSLTNK